MYILRDKNTHMGVNVSYTPDGLTWTSTSTGKLIAVKDATIKADTTSPMTNGMYTNYRIDGNTMRSGKYYVEPFDFNSPKTFKSNKFNFIEKTLAVKARRMLYSSWANNKEKVAI